MPLAIAESDAAADASSRPLIRQKKNDPQCLDWNFASNIRLN